MSATRGMLVGLNTSLSEQNYTRQGIDAGVRPDGRRWLDYRSITVQADVLPHVNGSARIVIAQGGTEVLATVKLETEQLAKGGPNRGRIEVSVECSNSLFYSFDDRSNENNAVLSRILSRIISESGALDMESLCIIPEKFCWCVYLDLLILQADGSLLDAASFAAYVAMNTALVPKVIRVEEENKAGDVDFEIDSDLAAAERISGCEQLPICISLSRVGEHFLADTSIEEESCVESRVVVGIDKYGSIRGIQKQGTGSLLPNQMPLIAQCALGLAVNIFKVLDNCIESMNTPPEEDEEGKHAYSAFLE